MVVCLALMVRSGYFFILPCFGAATIASVLFEVAYRPYSPEWLKEWYPWIVTPLLAFRALAVAEAFIVSSARFRDRRAVASAAVFIALLFAAVIAWRFAAADVLYSAIQARRVVVVGLAAFLGVYMLLMWSVGYRRSGLLDFHVLLLFLFCSVLSVTSILRMAGMLGSWQAAGEISYAACSLVYFTWALAFGLPRYPRGWRLPEIRLLNG